MKIRYFHLCDENCAILFSVPEKLKFSKAKLEILIPILLDNWPQNLIQSVCFDFIHR